MSGLGTRGTEGLSPCIADNNTKSKVVAELYCHLSFSKSLRAINPTNECRLVTISCIR